MQVPFAQGHNFMFTVKMLSAPIESVAMTVKVLFLSDKRTLSNVKLQVSTPVSEIDTDISKGEN